MNEKDPGLRDLPAGVSLNKDAAVVARLFEVMKRNGGYCPCRLQHTPENICPCTEFRAQLQDDKFSGYCHCRLYFKERK